MSNIIIKERTQHYIKVEVVALLIKVGNAWVANRSITLMTDINSTVIVMAKHPTSLWIGAMHISYVAGANKIAIYYPDSVERFEFKLPPIPEPVQISPFQVIYPNGITADTTFSSSSIIKNLNTKV